MREADITPELSSQINFLADPGNARGSHTNTVVINKVSQSLGHLFPQLTLWSLAAFLELPAASNHKIDYVTLVWEILNLKGKYNCTIASNVTVILLEGELCLLEWEGSAHRISS